MSTKNKIYLSLSVLTLFFTLFVILASSAPNGILTTSLPFQWIIIFVMVFLLLIFNVAEIIINKDDWNKFYWLGVVLNVATILFVIRYFKIELY
ncbi:hypothetical protein [Flavobacterium capsici]|uniref:Uncharacterized protein n=1 Tax=Flavobacterium capsici TaxID=3075618 RepID=A0AA96F2S7_9FLAO|nr:MULTISPECIES: hypothetical protein [unclassified Flavobacterium]WNM18801.1 hypothetical protein RN608_12405 [Flavobacterium sp. PMR2A8]WNM22852.1 hypothetical protein RN605_05705 [Flavobacterium sp. PMTSA4]